MEEDQMKELFGKTPFTKQTAAKFAC